MSEQQVTIDETMRSMQDLLQEIKSAKKQLFYENVLKNIGAFGLPLFGIVVLLFLGLHSVSGDLNLIAIHFALSFLFIAICVSILLALASFYFLRKIEKRVRKYKDDGLKETGKLIRSIHEPNISFIANRAELLNTSAKLLSDLLVEARLNESENFPIYMLGTGSLALSASALKRKLESGGQPENDPEIHYTNIFNECLDRKNIKIKRYVRLFEVDHKTPRDPVVLKEYIDWASSQIKRLGDATTANNYEIWSLRRAPAYKAARSTIATTKGYVDIFGTGETGIIIISKNIGEKLLREIEAFSSSTSEQSKPKQMVAKNLDSHLEAFANINELVYRRA